MTFKGQSNAEMLCWRQAVRHEDCAKKNFENGTGFYQDQNLYQGQHKDQHHKTMSTGFWNYGGKSLDYGNNPPQKEGLETVLPVRYQREGRVRTAMSCTSNRDPVEGEDPKNVTVFGRSNKKTATTYKFSMEPYNKVFNFDRKQAVEAKDAIIDRCQTLLPPKKEKDPGYHELGKRSTVQHDLHSKTIRDNQNRIIVKTDESYGLINGGIFGQMTHGGSTQYHSSPFRNSSLYKGNRFNQTACQTDFTKNQTLRKMTAAAEGDSTNKAALENKIYLIKKMISNEKTANQMISNELSGLVTDLHINSRTVKSSTDMLKAGRSGKVPQRM